MIKFIYDKEDCMFDFEVSGKMFLDVEVNDGQTYDELFIVFKSFLESVGYVFPEGSYICLATPEED